MELEELLELFDFSGIQEVLDQCSAGIDLSFGEIVGYITSGSWQAL